MGEESFSLAGNPLYTITGPHRYGNVSAKVSGMKSKLLKERDYIDLASVKNVEAVAEMLLRMDSYKKQLEAAFQHGKPTSEAIEEAANKRLSEVVEKLKLHFKGKDAELYKLFIKRYDILSAKVFFGELIKGRKPEEICPKMVCGTLNKEDWLEIVKSEAPLKAFMRKVFGNSGSNEAGKVSKLDVDMKTLNADNFVKLAEALDTLYLEELKDKAARSKAFQLLLYEADIQRLLLVVKMQSNNAKPDEFKEALDEIKAGLLSKRAFIQAFKDKKRLKELLKLFGIEGKAGENEGQENMAELYHKIKRQVAKQNKHTYSMTYFSIDRTLTFLLLLEEEIKNIKRIVVAKQLGMSKEDVLKSIVV